MNASVISFPWFRGSQARTSTGGGGDPVEEDADVLVGDVRVGVAAAGAVPPDGDPHGVADEAVGEGDVEVGAEHAGAHALLDQRDPDLARLHDAVGEVAERSEERV